RIPKERSEIRVRVRAGIATAFTQSRRDDSTPFTWKAQPSCVESHDSKGRAIRQAVVHEVHGPLLVESGRKLTQLPPQNRRRDLNYVSPNKQRSSVTFPCDFDHRAMPFEHARRSVTRVLTMKKPFDVLAEGLTSKNNRVDWTPLELFLAGQ